MTTNEVRKYGVGDAKSTNEIRKHEKARFYSPLKNFELEEQEIEIRRDELLGLKCRINIGRAKRVKQGVGDAKKGDISRLIESSRKKCFFCPENIESSTPKFPEEISKEGRIKKGEACVFPNLFPFARFHAVTTITTKHYLEINEFKEEQIENALKASIEFFKKVNKNYEDYKFPVFSWNYLFPSGASILHPHAQILIERKPTFFTRILMKASEDYYKKNKICYWDKILSEEERFIGEVGDVAWLASYAPTTNNEVVAIFKKSSSFFEITEKEISDFSKGLINIFKGYHKLGIKSFNLSSYSTSINEARKYGVKDARLVFKLCSRPLPTEYYTADTGFIEVFHQERVVEHIPEKLAKELRF